MKKSELLLLAFAAIITGCVSYGGTTRSSFSAFSQEDCSEKTRELFVFMESEQVAFEYERIGLIEVQGGEFTSLDEVMNEMKYEAWNNCANAIINVSHSNAIRESGTTFVEESETLYSAKVLTGLAVRIDLTDEFKAAHSSKAVSLDFIEKVDTRRTKETKTANTQVTASIIAGVVGLIVIIVAA